MKISSLLLTFLTFFCAGLIGLCTPLHAQQTARVSTGGVHYLEYLPAGHNTSGEKYPLLVYLHGAGDKGDGASQVWNVARMGPPLQIKNGSTMTFTVNGRQEKFIVISPQLSTSFPGFTSISATFFPYIFDRYSQYIDRSRVYLTGISMGGGGVWSIAGTNPEWFAAITPVCGAAWPDATAPCRIASGKVAVWAHHGDADNIVQISHSQEWIRRINTCTPAPTPAARLRVYPGQPHDISVPAFATDNSANTPNIYEWMLQYSKESNVTWNGANWAPQAPVSTDNVTFSGNYPPTGQTGISFTCKNLTVSTGATLTIKSGITVTTNGRFDNTGTVTMENGGSFVQGASSTQGTQTGVFTMQRQRYASQVTGTGIGYNLWSAPVTGQTTANLPGPAIWKFEYNAVNQAWALAAANSPLVIGRGYTGTLAGTQNITSFTGQPNNGNLSLPVSRNAAGRGNNLVGNPYPSTIDLQAFFADADNNELSGTAWLLDDNDQGQGVGTYIIANQLTGQRYVPAGQGFFVSANTAGTITFKNQHRVVGNNQNFFRGEGSDFELVQLSIKKPDGQGDVTYLGMGNGFSERFDHYYDSYKIDNPSGLNLSLSWDEKRWGSLALPEDKLARQSAIPLAVQVREGGEYKISAGQVANPMARPLFLEDRTSGEFYYLQPGREHTFTLGAGSHSNRFFLRFGNEVAGAENGQSAGMQLYSYGDQIYLGATGGANQTAEVFIFNAMGVEVEHFGQVQLGKSIQQLTTKIATTGVYIVKVSTAGQSYERRIWLGR